MSEAPKSVPSSQDSEQKSEQGPVWNPWENASSSENPSQDEHSSEQASSPVTEEVNQVPTPPPWPVEIKPSLPTNVPDLSKKEKPLSPPNLSSGEVIPEQKPQFETSEKEYHQEILELLKKIDEKLDKLMEKPPA